MIDNFLDYNKIILTYTIVYNIIFKQLNTKVNKRIVLKNHATALDRWSNLGSKTGSTYRSRKKAAVWRWKNSELTMSIQSTTVNGSAAIENKFQAQYTVTRTHYGTKFIMQKYTIISEFSWSKPTTKVDLFHCFINGR